MSEMTGPEPPELPDVTGLPQAPQLPGVGEGDLFEDVDGWLACLQAAHRLEARMGSFKARFAAELARSVLFDHADGHGTVNAVVSEVACALGMTRLAASRLVAVGRVTESLLLATGAALEVGDITVEKAWVIVEALRDVPPPVAWAVEELVLPRAPQRTTTQLRQDLARALIEVDAENADSRHEAARRQRRVTRPEVLPDGMARMSVFLPADDAVTLDVALDACASAALQAGDTRTCGQLRADALAEWARRTVERGWRFTTTTGAVRTTPTRINVTVPLEVLARAVPDIRLPETVAGVLARAEGFVAPEPATGDSAGEHALTGPLGGHRTEAPWLEGYGPIAPVIAHLLAAGGTWRRIITDTVTGAPLDIGRQRYRPPAHIAEAVRLRDRTCAHPVCSVPARACELDHVREWAHGGTTAADQLLCLCGRCHREKTVGAGHPGPRRKDGARDWVSATGRSYPMHPARQPRRHGGCDLRAAPEEADAGPPF